MIINSLNNTIPRASKLESHECCSKVNGNRKNRATAHTNGNLTNRKERCIEQVGKTNKQSNESAPVISTNHAYPGDDVSVEFAAKQFFQILLINIKYNHSKLESDLEPLSVPSEPNPLIINI